MIHLPTSPSPPAAPSLLRLPPSVPVDPVREDFAVVACHYNFADFDAPRRNLHRWLREMDRARVLVYGTELYLRHQQPQTEGRDGWRQIAVGPEAVMFQKEALLQSTVDRLPARVDKVLTLDTDLWFESDAWVEDSCMMLDHHLCGQPFSSAAWSGTAGEVIVERRAAAACDFRPDPTQGHPGFGWAFRRDFWERIGGFYPMSIMGGGDQLWVSAVGCSSLSIEAAAEKSGLSRDSGYPRHCERVRAAMDSSRPGWIPGRIWHEYHGSRRHRRYTTRGEAIAGIEPARDLRVTEGGYLAWTSSPSPRMRRRVAEYFQARKEDD